jgi:hypothetical protein
MGSEGFIDVFGKRGLVVSIAVARSMCGGSLDSSLGLRLRSVDGSTGRGIGPLRRIRRGGD